VHLLDEGLAARGHDVILLASAGSSSAGRLITLTETPLTNPGAERDVECLESLKAAAVDRATRILADERPDVVLNHWWRMIDNLRAQRALTTIHYPIDEPPWRERFLARSHATYISISQAQQHDAPWLRYAANVYNGVDVAALPFSGSPGTYAAFLGRACPEKGLDLAIRAARDVGMPLKVAAKVDRSQRPWFEGIVVPLMRHGDVEFLGELSQREKGPFLAGAAALLHPSRWSEPFGLAAVEAMACGTPVVALRRGAAAEIIDEGRTGFIVADASGLAAGLAQAATISRECCRRFVESRFDHRQMSASYEAVASRGAL
jgi:glycosyltransferase involved in cell wall biosynthesis